MWRHVASGTVLLSFGVLFTQGCGDEPTLCCALPGCPQALPSDGDACNIPGVVVGSGGDPSCNYCAAPGEVTDIAYCGSNGVFEVVGVSDYTCMTL